MKLAQFILVIVTLGLVGYTLRHRTRQSMRAWKKIGFSLLVLMMIVVILFPELTNSIAHSIGIGRGADLVLYATVVAFVTYVLNNYMHSNDQRDTSYRLARKIAILDAAEKYKHLLRSSKSS